jgi:hypothetical protein
MLIVSYATCKIHFLIYTLIKKMEANILKAIKIFNDMVLNMRNAKWFCTHTRKMKLKLNKRAQPHN